MVRAALFVTAGCYQIEPQMRLDETLRYTTPLEVHVSKVVLCRRVASLWMV
jgi:hypothetical protein